MDKEQYLEKIKGIKVKRKDIDAKEVGASVLIPLVYQQSQWQILFEKRALDLSHQPGEICFPGGKREQGESLRQNVIRETMEELLLKKKQIQIIKRLPVVMGPGMRRMGVFVGVISDYQGTFLSDEVDRVYLAPLTWFLQNEPKGYVIDVESRPREDFPFERIPGGRKYPWKKAERIVYFYDYPDMNLWGFSAGVMRDFIHQLRMEIE